MQNNNNKTENNQSDSEKAEEIKEKTEQQLAKEVERYKDVEGLSTRKLNLGLWYVEHRQLFKNIIIGFLIVVAAVSWSYTLYGLAYYVMRGMDEDNLLAEQLVQTSTIGHNYIASLGAKDLKYFPVNILVSSNNKYDLAALVQNINDRWYVEFDYYFLAGNEIFGRAHSFILPNEEKYLMALAQEFGVKPGQAQLVLENINWSRISRHKIPNWQDYKNSRLDIIIENAKFTPADTSKLSEKISLNQIDFEASNKTAYNYWQVDFQIVLFRGMDIVSVNKVSLNEFMSGEHRPVQVRWPGKISRVSKVEVIPELNIMKDDIYIKFE